MGACRRFSLATVLAAAMVLFAACASHPTRVYTSHDVDSLFLEKYLNQPIELNNETIIVDTRSDFDYAMIHAPGSVHVKWQDVVESEKTGLLRTDVSIDAKKLSRLGIGLESHVVVVGDGSKGQGETARVAWFLVYLGIRNVQIADLDSLGLRYSNIETPPRANVPEWQPKLVDSLIATKDEVAQIATGRVSGPFHIIDVRSKNEFFSKDRNLKYEHPELGAVNIEWKEFFDSQGHPNLDIRKKLQAIGIDRSHRVIVISNHGVRSGAVTFALTAIGFHNAGNYVGGYQELLKRSTR